MIFDHIVLSVSDLSKSKAFYSAALLLLGITLIKEVDGAQVLEFWISLRYGYVLIQLFRPLK